MKKNRPIDKFYKTIANAQEKIDAIRKNCKHKKTHMGLYSWRIGAMDNAELCNTCDAVIPNNNMVFGGITTVSSATINGSAITFGEDKK
jgi:hypothetical protein